MEYVVIVGSFLLVAFKFYLDREREEENRKRDAEWFKLFKDILNRKAARDFCEYTNGTEILEKTKHFDMMSEIEKEAAKQLEEIRGRQKPLFMHQQTPRVEAKVE